MIEFDTGAWYIAKLREVQEKEGVHRAAAQAKHDGLPIAQALEIIAKRRPHPLSAMSEQQMRLYFMQQMQNNPNPYPYGGIQFPENNYGIEIRDCRFFP